jgi:hypothetical protein
MVVVVVAAARCSQLPEREPANPKDKHCIAVHYLQPPAKPQHGPGASASPIQQQPSHTPQLVAWVPRQLAKILAVWLDNGRASIETVRG